MAQRGGVVDHDDVARERERREVGGAQQRRRAGRAQRQHELLPRVAGAVDQPRPRREHLVARRAAARAAGRRARAPSARRRRARDARRRGRRWRCGDRAAGVRVGVDGRSLVGGGARGVAHYTAALLEALAAAYPDDEYRVLLPRGRATVPRGRARGPPRAAGASAVRRRGVAGRPRLDACWATATWCGRPPRAARGGRHSVRADRPRPLVGGPPGGLHALRAALARGGPAAAAGAAGRAVLCDTEVGARRADRRMGLEPERVVTVAARAAALPAVSASPSRGTLLPLGRRARAAQGARRARGGFLRARERGLEAELIVAGTAGSTSRRPGVRRLGHVDDLGALYAGALAVVLPSWLEGFGLTPVEGIAAGTPAIVSDLPVLREVLGDGALYVPPGTPPALADALLRVAGDPALRERLLTAGRAQIAPLSWAETARRTRAVLAEAAGGERSRSSSCCTTRPGSCPRCSPRRRCCLEPPQLVVVDTGSRDDGPALARAAGAEVVELGANPGFGAANNAGVERRGTRSPSCSTRTASCSTGRSPGSPPRGRRRASGCRGCSSPTARSSARRTRSPARSARCCPRSSPPLLPRAAARARRAVPRRAAAHGRLGDRRLRRGADRRAAAARPVRRRASSSSSRTWTCACAPAPPAIPTVLDPSVRVRHLGGHATRPRLRRRAARAARPPPPRGRARQPRPAPRAALDDLAQALTFAIARRRAPRAGRDADRERAQLAAAACDPGHNERVSIRPLQPPDRDAFLEMVR